MYTSIFYHAGILHPSLHPILHFSDDASVYLSIIPRLIKNMIPMSPHALSPQHRRKPQILRHAGFGYNLVCAFRSADLEFTYLCRRKKEVSMSQVEVE
jgi:hypothetical protein